MRHTTTDSGFGNELIFVIILYFWNIHNCLFSQIMRSIGDGLYSNRTTTDFAAARPEGFCSPCRAIPELQRNYVLQYCDESGLPRHTFSNSFT